jgi:hypothetical protein
MKSYKITKTIAGLFFSAFLAGLSQAEVTLSDFSNFNLTGTYGSWGAGTFTSGATAFTVQAAANGGGWKDLAPAINASGNDTISIKLDVNPGNVADKFNIVLFDADGTARVYRFDGIAVGSNQTLTKNVASFLQDNNPGSVPGLNLANLTAFHLQGTFANADAINITFDNLSLIVAPFVPDQIPNGDFEAGGTNWATETTGPTISFPATGGNGNGHAVIDASVTEGFAAIKAFGGTEKTFASLGLSPGDICTVQMDMKILSGSNIGGLRLVGPEGFAPPPIRPAIIGDGSTWETYSIQFTVPASPAQTLFSLVWGFNSSVAFDNVQIVLPAPPPPVSAAIVKGTVVGWANPVPANSYQPQKRDNENDPWTDIGGPVSGTSVPFVFEETASNFYQVIETVPGAPENGVTNPGFENSEADIEPWAIAPQVSGATATSVASYLTYSPVSGSRMLKLEAENLANPVPPAEVGVRSNMIPVTAGTPYTVNFSGAVPELGVSFVVGCKLLYFNAFDQPAGNSAETTFSGNSWTPLAVAFTPPNGVTSVQVNFVLRGGAVPNVKSVCLIDNVVLTVPGAPITNDLAATVGPGVEISWTTINGRDYQLKTSGNLVDWTNSGSSVVGNGSIFSVAEPILPPGKKFYRVAETP